jgi:hypothetical protein
MKTKLLAAAAAIAIIASGVVATAQEKQENPKHDQRPAAERVEPKMAPKAEPGAKAAEGERREQPRAEGATNNQAPRTGEAQRTDAPKAAPAERRNAQDQGGERRNSAEMDQQKRDAEPRRNDAQRQSAPREEGRVGENPDTRNAPKTAQHDAAHGQPRVIGNVKSSEEHATRLRELLQGHGEREHAGVDINVGVRVPDGVSVYPLPAEVIAIAPEYRGYDYFIDDNDEVVFVSPETHEIVGAIEYEGRAASDEPTVNVAGARPCPVEN